MSAERTLKEKVVAGFFAASLAFPALMGASPVNAKIDYEGRSLFGFCMLCYLMYAALVFHLSISNDILECQEQNLPMSTCYQ